MCVHIFKDKSLSKISHGSLFLCFYNHALASEIIDHGKCAREDKRKVPSTCWQFLSPGVESIVCICACVCIHVGMHACFCACVHCEHACENVCTCAHAHAHACVPTCSARASVCPCVCTCTHVCAHMRAHVQCTCACACAHTCACVCVHECMHVCVYVHACTHTRSHILFHSVAIPTAASSPLETMVPHFLDTSPVALIHAHHECPCFRAAGAMGTLSRDLLFYGSYNRCVNGWKMFPYFDGCDWKALR